MIIRKCKGCLYALIDTIDERFLQNIPDQFIENQQKRDNYQYHITIINSEELINFEHEETDIEIKYLNLGLSKLQKDNNEVYYLFIYSNQLNNIRKQFHLEPKNFHITLGFKFNDIR